MNKNMNEKPLETLYLLLQKKREQEDNEPNQ